MKEYKYILAFDEANPVEVFPIWENGQAYESKREQNRQYHRRTLNGPFKFVREDFDRIHQAPYETKFWLDIFVKEPNETIYVPDIALVFYKTDIEDVNELDRIMVVNPEANDRYKTLLDKLNREFDLIELAPPIYDLNYTKEPVIQIAAVGVTPELIVTNILSGISFEQDTIATPLGGGDLILNYNFAFMGSFGVMISEDPDPDITGEYVDNEGALIQTAEGGWTRKDGAYRIRFKDWLDPNSPLQVVDTGSNAVVYETEADTTPTEERTFVSLLTGKTAQFKNRSFYGRYLTNEEIVNGVPTVPFPNPDLVGSALGYTRVIGFGHNGLIGTYGIGWQNTIIAHDGHQTAPNQWGKFDAAAWAYAGEYFTKPAGLGTGAIQPIRQSRWLENSYWFQFDSFTKGLVDEGATVETTSCYKFAEVVDVLLQQIDPSLSHQEDPAYSNFLYGTNAIRGVLKIPVLTPKALLLVGDNQEPARRAVIKFSDILNILQAWKADYYIDTARRFIIEHDQFFHDGYSYAGPNIGLDLTTFKEPKTRKAWEYRGNNYKDEKPSIPAQIKTEWMDETTFPFRGPPIEILSPFADQSQIDEIRMGIFNADLTFMLIASDRVSKDGFFFGEAQEVAGTLTIPTVTVDVGILGEYILQNGYAAWIFMQDAYHKYVMPASQANMNLEDITATSVKRTRLQELTIPAFAVSDINELVTTSLGDGRIRTLVDQRNQNGARIIIEHNSE